MLIEWSERGEALVGATSLTNGARASIVLVGPRSNPKGAMLVLPAADGESADTIPLERALDALLPAQVVEILCVQERSFGNSGLEPLELS